MTARPLADLLPAAARLLGVPDTGQDQARADLLAGARAEHLVVLLVDGLGSLQLMEQAGGRASTGRQPVLGVKPSALHQRIGLVFGSKNEVERIERYHREPSAYKDDANPLFVERSLFRD